MHSGESNPLSWTNLHDMPSRAFMPSMALRRLALRGLACMSALGWFSQPVSAAVSREPQPSDATAPYLPVIGASPLRFRPPPVPPPPVSRPTAGGPPLPSAAAGAPPSPDVIPPADKPQASHPDASAPDTATVPAVTPKPTPPPILPDDTRARVQPEDFLPFFQFPAGQSGDVQVITPIPATPTTPDRAPPSSATYRQRPE